MSLINQFKDVDEIVDWILDLNIQKKVPKGISKAAHETLLLIWENAQKIVQLQKNRFSIDEINNIKMMIPTWIGWLDRDFETVEDIEMMYQATDKPMEVNGKYAKYLKKDSTSYQTFLDNVADIEDFLSELRSYHSEPLDNLVIAFADKQDMKAKASYKSGEDTLYINPKVVGNTKEEYGSLRYVILHELGHRYLRYNGQSWDIDSNQFITTKYSTVESMTGQEKFAELFALSHWKNKYPEYKAQISVFEDIIE